MTRDPEEQASHGPVIRDKRRIDPETGQVRERPDAAPATAAAPTPDPSQVSDELAERTADLQRLQAEYLNYKRRVDRERENTRRNAVASTLGALLPVLDDIARARDHEELIGGFKAVAESLERTVGSLGMTTFGTVGDPFDPRIHEALMHSYSDDVEGPVCQVILQVGYQIDDRIVRPARVAVAEPSPATTAPDESAEPPDIEGPDTEASSTEAPDTEAPSIKAPDVEMADGSAEDEQSFSAGDGARSTSYDENGPEVASDEDEPADDTNTS